MQIKFFHRNKLTVKTVSQSICSPSNPKLNAHLTWLHHHHHGNKLISIFSCYEWYSGGPVCMMSNTEALDPLYRMVVNRNIARQTISAVFASYLHKFSRSSAHVSLKNFRFHITLRKQVKMIFFGGGWFLFAKALFKYLKFFFTCCLHCGQTIQLKMCHFN